MLYLLDIRLIDSLILLDVIGGRDGAPLSPGVRNNLTKTEREEKKVKNISMDQKMFS